MEPFISRNIDVSNRHMGSSWIYVGLDLGEKVWVAGFLDLRTCSYHCHRFTSNDVWQVVVAYLVDLRRREGCDIHVLYEAGRQGFELARQLRELGIHTDILAVSRLEIARKKKRGKSDRMDAKSLTYIDWTEKGFPLVWVPDRVQEDARNLLKWEASLAQSIRRCRNQSLSIFARWGIEYTRRMSPAVFRGRLDNVSSEMVGEVDHLRLESMWRKSEFLRSELEECECLCQKRMADDPIVRKLLVWKGIGNKSARVLSWYVGNWQRFGSGRSFAAYCGLTPVHVRSGNSDRDVGISRAGHRLLRSTFGILSLLWLRWQKESELAVRAQERMTRGKAGRLARTALARQLAVALWKWVVYDEPITGACQSIDKG